MATISDFGVTQHSQMFHFSLETEFNALRFINYTIPRLCSTYVVATIVLYFFIQLLLCLQAQVCFFLYRLTGEAQRSLFDFINSLAMRLAEFI